MPRRRSTENLAPSGRNKPQNRVIRKRTSAPLRMMKLRFWSETMKSQLAIAASRVCTPTKRQTAEKSASREENRLKDVLPIRKVKRDVPSVRRLDGGVAREQAGVRVVRLQITETAPEVDEEAHRDPYPQEPDRSDVEAGDVGHPAADAPPAMRAD